MNLEDLRAKIDHVDTELIRLLAARTKISLEVAEYKKIHNLPPLQKQRFVEMLADRVAQGEQLGLPESLITDIWTAIHDFSVNAQTKVI